MGIGYYGYAINAETMERAVAYRRDFPSEDPLADAWGLERGATFSVATFQQVLPVTAMLYLDKAWSHLQALTAPAEGETPRAAHRMFEGKVTMTAEGWESCVGALPPDQVAMTAHDLLAITEDSAKQRFRQLASYGRDPDARTEPRRDFITLPVNNVTRYTYLA